MPITTIDFETKDTLCTNDCEEWLADYKAAMNKQRAIIVRYTFVAFLMLAIWLPGMLSHDRVLPLVFQTGLFLCILRDIWVEKAHMDVLDSAAVLAGFVFLGGLIFTLLGYM